MTKYSEEIKNIRKISRNIIIEHLKNGPSTVHQIWDLVQTTNKKICNNSVECTCGKNRGTTPEWKHQVRWALQDLKYTNKIGYNNTKQEYFLK